MTFAANNHSHSEPGRGVYDRELDDLPVELRWREWMGRIEAAIFASASPLAREDLQKIVGTKASVDLLIADIQSELAGRPYELVEIASGWMFRTKSKFADAIKAVSDVGDQETSFSEFEMGVLCAIAYHQPVDRSGLADIFGKEISRDLLARLRFKELIATGPRSPRPGAPHTYVTTDAFLAMFGMSSLRDLPDLEVAEQTPGS